MNEKILVVDDEKEIADLIEVYLQNEDVYKRQVYNWGSQRLEYVPYRSGTGEEEGNWFMSFTDMVPGGIYKDRLKVENTTSNQTARVYMRIDPRVQEQIKDELLEKITMKVTFQGSVLYLALIHISFCNPGYHHQ